MIGRTSPTPEEMKPNTNNPCVILTGKWDSRGVEEATAYNEDSDILHLRKAGGTLSGGISLGTFPGENGASPTLGRQQTNRY